MFGARRMGDDFVASSRTKNKRQKKMRMVMKRWRRKFEGNDKRVNLRLQIKNRRVYEVCKVLACSLEQNSISYSSYAKLCFLCCRRRDWLRTAATSASNTHLNEAPTGIPRRERGEEMNEKAAKQPQKDVQKTFFIFHGWLSSHIRSWLGEMCAKKTIKNCIKTKYNPRKSLQENLSPRLLCALDQIKPAKGKDNIKRFSMNRKVNSEKKLNIPYLNRCRKRKMKGKNH